MCSIAIYEPIQCQKDDPNVLQINVMVNALKKSGICISIHNIWNEPQLFSEVRPLDEVLLRDGADALPLTIVDGEVYKKGQYPDYNELLKWSLKQ
ncbi:MAG: arsenic metallochaperone ArsD family protein [Eubacterium sp.]